MQARALTLTLTALAAFVLPACSRESTRPLDPGAPSPTRVVAEGVAYDAELRVLESYPARLQAQVRLTNTSDEPVEIRFPDGCVVLLRAYRSEDRSGQPAWDPMRGSLFCTMILVEFTLSPGESREFQATASAPEILGDSLPAGRYFFTALLRPNGRAVEVPAGQADLQR
jgi:hypothetical protein